MSPDADNGWMLRAPSGDIQLPPAELIYLSSDLHLWHDNIIRYSQRPWRDTDEMTEAIIGAHNAAVPPEACWICLGDLAFMRNENYESCKRLGKVIARMNGKRKILLMGNHDRMSMARYLSCGFERVIGKTEIASLEKDGLNIRLHHRPPFSDIKPDEDGPERMAFDISAPRHPECPAVTEPAICGHIHAMFRQYCAGPVLNVSVDVWDFAPVRLDRALELLFGTKQGI